ncbi:hypothetical protein SEA_KNOCKER_16 [Mycobacterium phage Knocker]|nr:hypothetical protein SEA_KNOCKER_16 [Mycobacterium phage Knocker]
MGCACGGRAGTSANGETTLGYYVILPNGGGILPEGFDPATFDPEDRTAVAPYFGVYEANAQVTLNRGGTIKRLKRKPAAA